MLLATLQTARASAANRATRRAAFTLLEVLIVVAILVILASAASFAYFRYLEDAKVGRAKSDMRIIESTLKKYYMENGTWPGQDQGGLRAITPLLEQGEAGIYDPWGQEYQYSIEQEQAPDGTVVEKAYVGCQPPNRQVIWVPDRNTKR